MTVGDRIRDLRKQRGLKQKELADALHIVQSTIAGWETGNREPSFEMLIKLSTFFNVTTDYLLDNNPFGDIAITFNEPEDPPYQAFNQAKMPDEKQNSDFGSNLRNIRKLINITQADLSDLLCVTQSTISAWESNKMEPNLQQIVRLAEILNTSSDVLLGIGTADAEDNRISMLYNCLNDAGKGALIEQAEFFVSSEKYKK